MEVIKQLCVAGEHAATRGAGYQPLLSVAPHVLSQTVPDLEEGIAACNTNIDYTVTANTVEHNRNVSLICNLRTCPVTEESLLLL